MARTIQKKIKFSKGQVVPELVERTDMEFYDSSAQTIKNMVSTVYGGVRSRSGTKFIDFITSVDERDPSATTSTICSDTSHFTDLTEVTTPALSTNKVLAKFDYGSSAAGTNRLEIKNIKVNPFTHTASTAGSGSVTVVAGTYQVKVVGGGSGGSASADQAKYAGKSREAAGASGGYVNAIYTLEAGTYNYVVGAGGAGTGTSSTAYGGWSTAGGTSSFADYITCTGGGRSWTQYNQSVTLGAGGTATATGYTTLVESKTGNQGQGASNYTTAYGGASYFGTYGKGGDATVASAVAYGLDGNDGAVQLTIVNPTVGLTISASDDDEAYSESTSVTIGENVTDVIASFTRRYRYIKVEVSTTGNIQSSITFQYMRNSLSLTDVSEVRLEKFVYDNTDKYLLVLSDEKVQVFKNDTLIQIIEATGMLGSYVRDVKVTSKDDTMILTHPDMHPKELRRTGVNTFTWSDMTIKNTPYYAFGGETETAKTTGITPSAVEGSVKITADSSIFDSTWVGQYIDGNGGRLRITEYTSGTVIKGVTVIPFYTTDKIESWKYISGYEEAWSTTRGWPTTCLFAQQRLWFGGSKNLPSHIWGSRLADYTNFKNAGNYDNDAIDITMLTNNKIINLVECRGIHVFTSGEEWTASEGSLTPDAFRLAINTSNGSYASIKPVVINGTVCYIEKNGRSLLSYVYDDNQASYVSDNLSILSNLISAPVGMSAEINSSVDKGDFLYIVKNDGTMLVACISLQQNIMSLSQFITEGTIFDVCCIDGETYVAVIRNNSMCIEKIIQGSQTDCYKEVYVSSTTITGLPQYEGNYVYVYSTNKNYGKYLVSNGSVELDETPYSSCNVGIAYDYELESNPIAVNHKTDTLKKRISKATVLCKDTDEISFSGQKKTSKRDLFEFFACTKYDKDVRFKITGSFKPVNILSITLDINYEG